jgi:4-hydroxy-2-oxoglutarate aldolase
MEHRFKGVLAPLTTPFAGEEISLKKFKDNIQKYNQYDLSGYVVLGSTGESVYLSDEESEKLVAGAKEVTSPAKKIIAGTGKESTKLTLEFTNRLAALGIDAALVRTPFYFKQRMDREALKKHYLALADNAKVPIVIYNNPQVTGITVESEMLLELANHPNIAGIKDSSGNLAFLGEVIPHLKPPVSFLVGTASVFLSGLMLGASGGILALADAAPGLCVKLYNLFQEGKMEEARELQLKLVPLNKILTQTYGVPGIKYALDCQGFYGAEPRPPLLPVEEKGKKEIATLLKIAGLLE